MEISRKRISFDEVLSLEFITMEKREKIIQGIIEILIEKMRRYTGGDSSLSKEKTQSLMDSIQYTLSFYLRKLDIQEVIELLNFSDIKQIYRQSEHYLLQELHNLYNRIQDLQNCQLHLDLAVYQQTINQGLTAFFEVYNFDYCTQDIVLTLDYPTCRPLLHQGLEKIIEYVDYLQIEHVFLHCFQETDIQMVLMNYCFYEQGMIDNVSLLFINQLLMKGLIGRTQELIFQNQEEIECLYQLLLAHSQLEIYQLLRNGLESLVRCLPIFQQREIFDYYEYILDDLSSQLVQHSQFHTLEKAISIRV